MEISEKKLYGGITVNGIVSEGQKKFIQSTNLYVESLDAFRDEFMYYIGNLGNDDADIKFKKFYINEISKINKLQGVVLENKIFSSKNIVEDESYDECINCRDAVIRYLESLLSIIEKQF